MNRIFLLLALLISSVGDTLAAYPEESVPPRHSFSSPDGRYSVQLIEVDRQWRYAIKDVRTGHVDDAITMPTVLLYLHWAEDSQSIVTVEHVAKGSCGRVIYREDDHWVNVEVKPPANGWTEFSVVRLEIKPGRASYRFVARHVQNNGMPVDHMFCDLDVTLGTGQIANINWTAISEAEEMASLSTKPIYDPPMNHMD